MIEKLSKDIRLCLMFLHVVQVRKHMDMWESHAKHMWFLHVSVFSDLCNVSVT